jgi:hypothetical protein
MEEPTLCMFLCEANYLVDGTDSLPLNLWSMVWHVPVGKPGREGRESGQRSIREVEGWGWGAAKAIVKTLKFSLHGI